MSRERGVGACPLVRRLGLTLRVCGLAKHFKQECVAGQISSLARSLGPAAGCSVEQPGVLAVLW